MLLLLRFFYVFSKSKIQKVVTFYVFLPGFVRFLELCSVGFSAVADNVGLSSFV